MLIERTFKMKTLFNIIFLFYIHTHCNAQTRTTFNDAKQSFDRAYKEFKDRRIFDGNYDKYVFKLDNSFKKLLIFPQSYSIDFKKYRDEWGNQLFDDYIILDSIKSSITNFRVVQFCEKLSDAKGLCQFHTYFQWTINDSTCNVYKPEQFYLSGQEPKMYKLKDSIFLIISSSNGTCFASCLRFDKTKFIPQQTIFPNYYFNQLQNKDCKNLKVDPAYLMCFECEMKYNFENKTINFDYLFQCVIEEEFGFKNMCFTFEDDHFSLTTQKRK